MERKNSVTGLASLGKAQSELLAKTDQLSKLLETTTYILQQTQQELADTRKEYEAERIKNADLLDHIING